MSKGLDYFAAFDLMLTGKAVRRAAWHRWLTWEHWLGWTTQPAVDALEADKRIATETDFTRAEFLATDWTDEPWDAAFPAPIVEASVPASGSGSTGAASGSGGASGGGVPTLTPSTRWGLSSSGGGGGGGGGGNRGKVRPHNPPTSNTATVTVSYQTDLEPGGANGSCLLASQSGSGQTCKVIMTVSISGGPTGVFGLHIQLGAYTKSAESGYNGYTRDFSFEGVPVNPGAHLTPNVIYHATGGDVTASSPDFTFLPTCTAPITFAVRFQGTLNFTSRASGEPPDPAHPDEHPTQTLGTHGYSYDFTKTYTVAGDAATGATAVEVAPTSQSAAWHCTGAGSTHSDACFAPATLTVNVASGVVSNPSGEVVPPTEYQDAVVTLQNTATLPFPEEDPDGGNTETAAIA